MWQIPRYHGNEHNTSAYMNIYDGRQQRRVAMAHLRLHLTNQSCTTAIVGLRHINLCHVFSLDTNLTSNSVPSLTPQTCCKGLCPIHSSISLPSLLTSITTSGLISLNMSTPSSYLPTHISSLPLWLAIPPYSLPSLHSIPHCLIHHTEGQG